MKSFIIALVLVSTSAFAHPTDNDPIDSLGIGTKIKVLKDLNIVPTGYGVILGSEVEKQCYFQVKNIVDYDRVIQANTIYKVVSIKTKREAPICPYWETDCYDGLNSSFIHKVELDSSEISITCRDNNSYSGVSIGEFKRMSAGKIEVKFADPIIVR